ncbi:MAG: Na/Pi cotransporter family protein [Planctomycetales bacterium]|nr:Na/Pi cotransporter family protein [Planctomycetales bacterium]
MNISAMMMELLGGLAIFLYGMDQMTSTLRLVAGERMKAVLASLTANRFKGVLAGAFVTSVIQSSSVTTVLVVGFVSAGLMSLKQSIGIIMGASIGTTITAQIIAFKITKIALALVSVGFAMQLSSKRERLQNYGKMIFGFGLLFFGMEIMSDAMQPLKEYQPFIDVAKNLNSAVVGILLSSIFTAVIQSSSATTVMVILLAGQGLISLEQSIPLILGANIGTCITALLASIGKSADAVRTAVVHVTFNTLGVLLWFNFMDVLASWTEWLSSDISRQIANSHTIFNVVNTCIFIWFVNPLANFVTFIVPDRKQVESETAQPMHLDELLLKTPGLALGAVRMELGRLGVAALNMVRGALTASVRGTQRELDRLERLDDDVDALHAAIIVYLGRISRDNLNNIDVKQLSDYLLVANYFESIGDMIESSLVSVGRQRLLEGLQVSQATETLMKAIHHEVCWAIERSIRALVDGNYEIAMEVMASKESVNKLVMEAEEHLSRRLTACEPHRLVAYRLESEIMEYLKRMYYFAKRIAKITVDNFEPSQDEQLETNLSASGSKSFEN